MEGFLTIVLLLVVVVIVVKPQIYIFKDCNNIHLDR